MRTRRQRPVEQSFLEGRLGGRLGGPAAPHPHLHPWGGNQITKKRGNVGRKRKRNRTEVAFPGLGPGEGRPWNLFRKPSNQLAMFLDVFFFSPTILAILVRFHDYKCLSCGCLTQSQCSQETLSRSSETRMWPPDPRCLDN